MTSQARSPRSESRSTNPYRTIYHGVATDREGRFDHFNRMIDDSHRENGYWRFDTRLDEHRAYARGLYTPEDLLMAVNGGDGFCDEISLVWQPGYIDTNMQDAIIGSAAQHLKNIYDARYHLGKTLSLRGMIPIYPVHERLDGYWPSTPLVSTAPAGRPVVLATAGPASSPPLSASVPSPAVGATTKLQRTPSGSSITQIIVRSDFENSTTPITKVRSLTQSPSQSPYRINDSPQTRLSSSTSSSSSQMPTLAGRRLNKSGTQDSRSGSPVGSHCNPQAFTAPPDSSALYISRSQTGMARCTQSYQALQERERPRVHQVPSENRHLASPIQPTQAPPLSSLQQCADLSQQAEREVGSSKVGPVTGCQYTSPYGALPTSYRSPYSGSISPAVQQPGHSYLPQRPSMTPTPNANRQDSALNAQVHVDSRVLKHLDNKVPEHLLPHKKTPPADPHSAGLLQSLKTIHYPTLTAYSAERRDSQREEAERLARSPRPAQRGPEHFVDGNKRPKYAARELTSDTSNTIVPSTIIDGSSTASQLESPIIPTTELPVQQAKSLKRPKEADRDDAGQMKKLKFGTHDSPVHTPSSEQVQSPLSDTDMYQCLPCMDCGEEVGHKSDCNVGSKSSTFSLSQQ
jgi:hypothetical protein